MAQSVHEIQSAACMGSAGANPFPLKAVFRLSDPPVRTYDSGSDNKMSDRGKTDDAGREVPFKNLKNSHDLDD